MRAAKKTATSRQPEHASGKPKMKSAKHAKSARPGIAARLMKQPTPACDCTRCGMDYCDCSEEQCKTTVPAAKAHVAKGALD